MPIYEFRCPACDFEFEEFLPVGKGAACSRCGREDVNRKISGFHTLGRRIPAVAELPRSTSSEPAYARREASFNGMHLKNVRITNAHVGLGIGPNGKIRSRGLQIDNCDVGIDNSGSFDGPDTIIK